MTAGERLRTLAGVGGTAGALMLLIGAGATAGAALVDYSQLGSNTAAVHILVDHAATTPTVPGSGGGSLAGGTLTEAQIASIQAMKYMVMARTDDEVILEVIISATTQGLLT